MTNIDTSSRNGASSGGFPSVLPPAALTGVRSRRIMAVILDLIIVGILSSVLFFVLGLATFGLLWFILPPLFPIIAFFYNGLTISGWRMATLGMKAMDLEMRLSSGARVPFLNAAVHAVLFYVSWMFPPILLVSLLDGKKRCLHDMLADVVVTRRAN